MYVYFSNLNEMSDRKIIYVYSQGIKYFKLRNVQIQIFNNEIDLSDMILTFASSIQTYNFLISIQSKYFS